MQCFCMLRVKIKFGYGKLEREKNDDACKVSACIEEKLNFGLENLKRGEINVAFRFEN